MYLKRSFKKPLDIDQLKHYVLTNKCQQSNSSLSPKSNVSYSDSQKENVQVSMQSKPEAPTTLSRVLGDMTNCTIQNMTINVNPSITITRSAQEIEEEFDTLVSRI